MPRFSFRCPDCASVLSSLDIQSIGRELQCSSCGRMFSFSDGYLDMMPADLAAGKVQIDHEPFWDLDVDIRGIPSYNTVHLVRKYAPRLIGIVDKFAPGGRERQLLDIGLGTVTSRRIRHHYKSLPEIVGTYTALDPSEGQLSGGGEMPGMNSLFIRGIGENIPFDDGQFDVVLNLSTLDHFFDAEKGKTEMARILKDKGLLVLGLNNDKSWFKLLFRRRAASARKAAAAEHNFFFSVNDVLAMFGDEFDLKCEYDWRYLPLLFSTKNSILGPLYFGLLRIADQLGRLILPRRGGCFYLFLIRRSRDETA